jgi:heat shock protein HslJ
MKSPNARPALTAAAAAFLLLVLQELAASEIFSQASPLSGTRWQLVAIQSMDDSTYTPRDSADYTLAFNADHSFAIRSGCNQVQGRWTAEGSSQLTFSEMAGTQAVCPGDTLDERYRAQFEWVRSYMLRDGHLFMATMADGSIIEFSPAAETRVVARLMGENLQSDDPEEVQAQILDRLFADYAARNDLAPTEAEIEAYVTHMERAVAEELGDEAESIEDLTPDEQADYRTMQREMARAMIGRWKLNRALYEQYGGRVIFQQLGPEPLDAYRVYLEERSNAGDFMFLDETFEAAFWRYFHDEPIHSFYPPDEADDVFASAPWEQ